MDLAVDGLEEGRAGLGLQQVGCLGDRRQLVQIGVEGSGDGGAQLRGEQLDLELAAEYPASFIVKLFFPFHPLGN